MSSPRPPWDPFRLLAVAAIVLGMLIVIGGCLVWFFTGRQVPDVIFGGGLTLTLGGGLREWAATAIERFPRYAPPPAELPQPPPPAPPPLPPPSANGSG